MVISKAENDKQDIATIATDDRTEKYVCAFWACANPVCTCETLTIEFSPVPGDDRSDGQAPSHTVDIDVGKIRLKFDAGTNASTGGREFSELVFSQLDEDDFKLLFQRHFEYKNQITENAAVEDIDAVFDYVDIEMNGTMSAYNDVLPYGDQLFVSIDGKRCMALDQYCLLPKCTCSHTMLSLMTADTTIETQMELGTFEVDYRKRRWKTMEGLSFDLSAPAAQKVVEEQVPGFYRLLLKRHEKLKAIYAYSKKRHLAPKIPTRAPKAGRNAPCPCGSGKKYKKCCMNK